MRLRAIPGYSALYVDYIEDAASTVPWLPLRPNRETLFAAASRVGERQLAREELCTLLSEQASGLGVGKGSLESIRLLGMPGTVVVLVSMPAGLFGGPLSHLLRCLTAIRLTTELRQGGIPAVPLLWIQAEDEVSCTVRSVSLLDSDSRLVQLSADGPEGSSSDALLAKVGEVAPGSDVLRTLEAACAPGTARGRASAAFLARFLEPWGLVVLDPQAPEFRAFRERAAARSGSDSAELESLLDAQHLKLVSAGYGPPEMEAGLALGKRSAHRHLVQNALLPVAASVVGDCDIRAFVLALPLIQRLVQQAPLAWPRVSATIVDARSRKILDKYHLALDDLFGAMPNVLRKTGLEDTERLAAARLDEAINEARQSMDRIAALAPGDGLGTEVSASRDKILYQLTKMKERILAAGSLRREAATRQLERACNVLAPARRPQECEIATLHFLLRHRPAIVAEISERLDIWTHDHQLINVE